jgi:DNA-binding NtrC family response regulator
MMPSGPRVLVIDADESQRSRLIGALESEGFKCQAAMNRVQASALLRSLRFEAIVSAVRLPDGDCEQIFREAPSCLGSTPIIFTTARGDIDKAVRLVKAGAADYVQKPYDVPALVARLRQIIADRGARNDAPKENTAVTDAIMISRSMIDLKKRVERLAACTVNVFINGETGSGKEIIARQMHRLSARADEPFVAVRCGSLAGQDGERRLFGEAIRSAANGSKFRRGALEQAGRGTLFLDEISEFPANLQAHLIQVIDSGRFAHIGDTETEFPFGARILAGSHLTAATLRERMSPDLINLIAVVEITVPPLRERRDDIEPLVNALLPDVAADLGTPPLAIDAEALAAMRVHDWPGNVRELRNRLAQALTFATGSKIGMADLFHEEIALPEEIAETVNLADRLSLNDARAEAERERIVEALALNLGRIGRTAESLGVSRVTLWTKMKRLGLSLQPPSKDNAATFDRPAYGRSLEQRRGTTSARDNSPKAIIKR